jgi:hypothetical protein
VISVIVPTVPGREARLERCLDAYRRRTVAAVELIVIHDAPTCGVAWNVGAGKARGDYLHWTADDLEPADGWDLAARETADTGAIPAPVVLRPNGTVESSGGFWDRQVADGQPTDNTSVVPFCTAEQWERLGPHLETHYFNDNYFTWRARQAGMDVIVRTGYALTHHWALPGRKGDEQMRRDQQTFLAATG